MTMTKTRPRFLVGSVFPFLLIVFHTSLTLAQKEIDTLEPTCPFGIYGQNNDPCICLTQGLWGLLSDFCTAPLALRAVAENASYCVPNTLPEKVQMLQRLLTLEQPEVAQLSASMNKFIDRFDSYTTSVPFPSDVYPNASTLITYGAPQWTLTTENNFQVCLIHAASHTTHYCVFPEIEFQGKMLKVQGLLPGCRGPFSKIHSAQCIPLERNRSCEVAIELSTTTPNPTTTTTTSTTTPKPQKHTTTPPPTTTSTTTEYFSITNQTWYNSTARPHLKATTQSMKETDEDPFSPEGLFKMYKFLTSDPDDLQSNSILKREDKGEEDGEGPKSMVDETGPGGLLDENEDHMKPGAEEIGHKLMREQIDQYVDTVIATLVGLNEGSTTAPPKERIPVLRILKLIKLIMQKTCPAVKSDFFELALNSFLKVQLESFHAKEPYVSHNVFVRIDYALKKCYNNAKPHNFVMSNSTCSKIKGTSMELDVFGDGKEIVTLEETPPYARGLLDTGSIREPLTESVWKMLINAHSYCYPYFKAYFNDHHALTVALLPLFNNAIQDIWLKEGGYDVEKKRLYGGMLGDVKKVLVDVDNCVLASRHVSKYPWYMSRPMRDSGNKWRKKRELPQNPEVLAPTPVYIHGGNALCLFDPDDPVAFLGKPVCTS